MAEPVVSDATGRAAVERVLEGVAQTQAASGDLPGGDAARQWAREVAERQIRRHEEREARAGIDELRGLSAPDPVDPATSPARLDRGEVPADAEVIRSGLEPGPGATPQTLAHMGLGPQVPIEDQLLLQRVKFLCRVDHLGRAVYPEWHARVDRAMRDGEHRAMTSGSALDRDDAWRRHVFMAEEVVKVVELSNATFGDYRLPPKRSETLVAAGGRVITVTKDPEPDAPAAVGPEEKRP